MIEENLTWSKAGMNENRYNLAGWLAIVAAIIFPLSIGLDIIQNLIGAAAFGYRGPNFGPSDLLMIAFSGMAIYVLVMFRRLLHENYQYHDLDVLITIAIIWTAVIQAASIGLAIVSFILWPRAETVVIVLQIVFMILFMISAGIIDIIFAVKLFKIMDRASSLVKVLAYLTMIAGVLEVTVILSPLALFLVPASFIVYGLIFLRANQEVEFV